MGTRADFYIEKDKKLRRLGSIHWDGYPREIPYQILSSTKEINFLENVEKFLRTKEDGTISVDDQLIPYITDFSYVFSKGKVYASHFGKFWFDPIKYLHSNNMKYSKREVDIPEFPKLDISKFLQPEKVKMSDKIRSVIDRCRLWLERAFLRRDSG